MSASSKPIRLTSVMGVARALLSTFPPQEAVEVLEIEFGWDVTFQALLLLRGEDAEQALLQTLELLLTAPMSDELRDIQWRTASWTD